MKFKLKLIFSVTTIVLFFALPQTSFAALGQPPGQFPITEPLKPIEPGVQPNYSGNIQDGKPVILEETEEGNFNAQTNQSQQTTIDPVTGQPVTANITVVEEKGRGKIWLAGVILLMVVGGGLWLWRKKKPSGITSALLLEIAMFSVTLLGVEANLALAQSEPRVNNPNQNITEPIQRTITSEEEIAIAEQGPKTDIKKALYAITAVVMLVAAGGATYSYWVKPPTKNNPTSPTPPQL